MAKNDIVLVDSVIDKLVNQNNGKYDISEQFELFCFDQLLKDYDLSFDEIEFGWVDGNNDGGIDGMFVFIDDKLITSPVKSDDYRKRTNIDMVIVTCKHANTFLQIPINNLIASIDELLDLSKDTSEIISKFNEDVLRIRDLFRDSYIELADKNPCLKVRIVYASRGDTGQVSENVQARADQLEKLVNQKHFSDANVGFSFCGAAELLTLYRKSKSFSLRLRFTESFISRADTNYIILSKLDDFYSFITDDQGKLRRYLFESNVRDYLSSNAVNQDIAETLLSGETKEDFDFWWLNNGITLLASRANVAGKEISLENIQIVNGLQTTETIFNNYSKISSTDRAVLIKIIIASEDDIRDRIIKATNNQTKVELASLRATDKIQKDIEQVLFDNGWYYDRKKNYYKNQGMPQDRIITVGYLSTAIYALCLKDIREAAKPKPRFLRNDGLYNHVFNKGWELEVFLSCVEIMKKMELALSKHSLTDDEDSIAKPQAAPAFAAAYAHMILGTNYQPNDLIKLKNEDVGKAEVDEAWKIMRVAREKYMKLTGAKTAKRAHKKKQFLKIVKQLIDHPIPAVDTAEAEEL